MLAVDVIHVPFSLSLVKKQIEQFLYTYTTIWHTPYQASANLQRKNKTLM